MSSENVESKCQNSSLLKTREIVSSAGDATLSYSSGESVSLPKDATFSCSARENVRQSKDATFSCSQCIDISFKNLTYSVSISHFSKEKKHILKDIDGLFKCGELTVIMGPSGAGKTSLLNVLSGFIKEGVGGKMYANNVEVGTGRGTNKPLSAYIMHEDHLDPNFTVEETMLHAANMKLDKGYNKKMKKILIEQILNSMSMWDTKNTRCNRLSGGEKKRLNVCLELIGDPPILFLDEPTSGLDSSNCSLLVDELKKLAKCNRTVICTIHQPSATIFALFDHLYLIDSGRTVYQGNASNLLPFLEQVGLPCPMFHNPADYVMDLVVGEFGCFTEQLIQKSKSNNWRESSSMELHDRSENQSKQGFDSGEVILDEKIDKTRKAPSEWSRYLYLVGKISRQLNRDWVMTYMKIPMHTMSALSIGILFYKLGDDATMAITNSMYLFISSVYICYTTIMPATIKFAPQLMVIKREHFNNWYKFKTYFLAFCTVDIPVQVISTFVFLSISYLMTGQPLELKRFFLLFVSIALETIISDMFGIMMGTVELPVNGIFMGSIYLTTTFLLCGYFVPIKNLLGFLRILSYFSFLRYSFELKLIAIYGLGRGKFICPDKKLYCHVRHPKKVFDFMGLEDDQTVRDMTALVTFTLVITLLAYVRLRFTLKKFR